MFSENSHQIVNISRHMRQSRYYEKQIISFG